MLPNMAGMDPNSTTLKQLTGFTPSMGLVFSEMNVVAQLKQVTRPSSHGPAHMAQHAWHSSHGTAHMAHLTRYRAHGAGRMGQVAWHRAYGGSCPSYRWSVRLRVWRLPH